MRCPKCGADHKNYESIEQALDIIMDESIDADCRIAARNWIIQVINYHDHKGLSIKGTDRLERVFLH